jgi:holdfast attachment protein HfaA
MLNLAKTLLASAATTAILSFGGIAQAGDYSSDSTYSSGYGMQAGQENNPVNASLRDSNGNLEVVNGQFQSSSMSQSSGVQQISPIGSTITSTGVAWGGSSTMFGNSSATAIGNSLNVVTLGSNNTIVVDAHQTNNGDQNANIDGH